MAALLWCAMISAAIGSAGPVGREVDRTRLWHRSGRDLLSGFCNMYNFHVLREPRGAFPYRARFFGWAAADGNPGYPGCDAIFAARSRHLLRGWQVYAGERGWVSGEPAAWVPVLTARDLYFDQWHNGDPSVVRVGGRYFMAYSSTGHDADGLPLGAQGDKDGSYLCVMGAVSSDGLHWVRSSKPILAYSGEYGRMEPVGDVVLYGSYHRPSLMWEEGEFRLWFDYWAGTEAGVSMGYAVNRGDFLNPSDWKIVCGGDRPALPHFPNPDVVRVGRLYFAYGDPGGYGSHPWRSRKIVEAVSADGINWLVLGYVNPDPGVAATHVPEAFVRRLHQGRWRIYVFYACQVGGEPYNYRYDRLRCMWRDVTAEELAALGRLCRRRAHAEPCESVRAPALLALGSLLVRGRMVERREAGTGSFPQDFRRRSR